VCSEGSTYRKLRLPANRPGEDEVRDIRTGNHEDEQRCGQEDGERRARIRGELLAKGHHPDAELRAAWISLAVVGLDRRIRAQHLLARAT
jgi:hypothetical protein